DDAGNAGHDLRPPGRYGEHEHGKIGRHGSNRHQDVDLLRQLTVDRATDIAEPDPAEDQGDRGAVQDGDGAAHDCFLYSLMNLIVNMASESERPVSSVCIIRGSLCCICWYSSLRPSVGRSAGLIVSCSCFILATWR